MGLNSSVLVAYVVNNFSRLQLLSARFFHPLIRYMAGSNIVFSRRLRETPFEQRALQEGAKAFTIYNHMPLSSVYQSPQEDYAHLCEHVQLWDVSCERQVEVSGPDALALVELITPRDISQCAIGQCLYAPLVDENGGIVNDPIILRVGENRYWISVADSDVVLWVKGIAYGKSMDVAVFEPDVSPLAVQGPKADDLMAEVVGPEVRDIKFFWFIDAVIAGTEVKIARSGWSGQGGFEIYLQDSSKGFDLWDTIWEAGKAFNIRAGCPNLIERLESSLLSYGSDMTLESNPFESGLDRFVDIDKKAEYMGREALQKIKRDGLQRKKVNLFIEGKAIDSPRSTFDVCNQAGEKIGILTSVAYSTKFDSILAFAIVDIAYAEKGMPLKVSTAQGIRNAVVKSSNWK